jgi:RNA polymerase subunit RPABC4/transcription elongation factor Spt4
MDAFCGKCERAVYVSKGDAATCPVCLSPLAVAEIEADEVA